MHLPSNFQKRKCKDKIKHTGEKHKIYALHSTIPMEEQAAAFQEPPPDIVNVYLASTIAESSVTLPKVRVVIDLSLKRMLGYDKSRDAASLITSWISHASASQRTGRCGRVCSGVSIRMVPRNFYKTAMSPYDQVRENLRNNFCYKIFNIGPQVIVIAILCMLPGYFHQTSCRNCCCR